MRFHKSFFCVAAVALLTGCAGYIATPGDSGPSLSEKLEQQAQVTCAGLGFDVDNPLHTSCVANVYERLAVTWSAYAAQSASNAPTFIYRGASAPTVIQPFGPGEIVTTPGQPTTTIMPFGPGAIVNTPGYAPTTVQPFGPGAIINAPGQAATTVMPFGPGAIVNTPGAPATTIMPFGPNGAIANTPGRRPVVCHTFGMFTTCN